MSRSLRVRYESQEAFARAWEESLSRGVVFAHTDAPPRAQARVQVELELAFAGRKASLEGEVVHRVESGPGAGVAVELLAPLAALRAKLGPLAEGAGGAAKPAAGKGSGTPGSAKGGARSIAASPRPVPQTEAEAADEDALDLGDPVDDAAALEAAGLAEGDLDVSDDDLASVLGGGEEGGAPAPAVAGVDTSSRTLAPLPPDPDDPYASLDPGALVLSEDDPEPTPAPEALPPDGVPYDPHERELD